MIKSRYLILIIALLSSVYNAQSCGFGCLGFSGGYGGYTIQRYDLKGFNDYLKEDLTALGFEVGDDVFSEARGFRVGINLFKARFEGVYFGAKFFYQFLEEEKSYVSNLLTNERRVFNLGFDYYGLGGELGFPIISFLDLKLVEGGVTLHNVNLKDELYIGETVFSEVKYESTGTQIGYYVGSGLIIHLIKNYISIEGTASYNFVDLEEVRSDNNEVIPQPNGVVSFGQKGGVTGTVQLNVSFPL
ncbi:MAG: hypothetical protein SCALA702_08350 [Melioribacteraceae bacterium]|nr:MAG: hypothetical protein SCALA702_08350 [Melioribacteraceae bacterium]